MKLGKNVHEHELFEHLSLAYQNWPIFKMAVLNSKMAAKNDRLGNEDFT